MEQLVARRAHNPKARGSSPLPATKIKAFILNKIKIKAFLLGNYLATISLMYANQLHCGIVAVGSSLGS